MRYDDKIIYPEEAVIPVEIQEIIDKVKAYFPKYALAGSVVTAEFIRIVSTVFDEETDPLTLSSDDWLSDQEVKAVIERLPMELIVHPISPDTITAIIERLCRGIDDVFFECSLFGECEDAFEYSLRAAAKEELGLHEEALKDYSMACVLEPGDHMYLLDRANVLNKIGQISDALNDALRAFEMIRDTCTDNVQNLQDMHYLAFIFDECKDTKMSVVAMLQFVESFNSLMPFISFGKESGFTIDKNGLEYSSGLHIFEAFIAMIKDVEAKNTGNMEVTAILERLKNEISISRAKVGF